MIQKIYICSDFLSTKLSEQTPNNKWMFDLFKHPIYKSTNINIELFEEDLVPFNRERFFFLSNIKFDKNANHFDFDNNLISNDSIKYLLKSIPNNTLFIGYEFSETTKEIFNSLHIPFIDMWLSPIRFLDDILFAFNSNNEKIFNAIKGYEINKEYFHLYANKVKVQTYKGWHRPNIDIMDNSILFIGQMLQDKAINNNNKMLNILDFKKEIKEYLKSYSKIYYSKHPYLRSGDEKIMEYIKNNPKIELINYDSYHLLSDKRIKKVVSVSSSLLEEAKYFEKEVDYLFKPILKLGSSFEKNEYINVYQQIINPKFWKTILEPIVKVNENVEDINFLDSKDKIRDILGFYWSYNSIDKVEKMRTSKKKKFPPRVKFEDGYKNEYILNNFKDKIINFEVVSFDIFDTLLVRPFSDPHDLFKLMNKEVLRISEGKITDFASYRSNVRNKIQKEDYNFEILLPHRYYIIQKEFSLTSEQTEEIMNLEVKLEKKLLRTRTFLVEMFNICKVEGKRIFITSDMYLDINIIKDILSINNINGYEDIVLSSVEDLTKHEGSLFKILIEKSKISPDKILHIGDNKHSDIKKAEENGIKAIYIEKTIEEFYSKNSTFIQLDNDIVNSISRGLIANKNHDFLYNFKTPSFFNKEAYFLGYNLFGNLFLFLVKEMIENAIKKNIKVLYFLSRDGEIMKKCYDLVAPFYPEAPKSEYVYCSRRSILVANLSEESDIINLLNIPFNETTINTLLSNRFGLEKINKPELNEVLNYRTDFELIKNKILEFKEDIFKSSSIERKNLLKYYNEMGMAEDNIGIVDIGHNGNLQFGINKLLNKELYGFYFFLFDNIENLIPNKDMYWSFYNNKDTKLDYRKNILMFETIFLNDNDTFIKQNNNQGVFFKPDYKQITKMKEYSLASHNGIVDYVKEFLFVIEYQLLDQTINKNKLCDSFLTMLRSPSFYDTYIFQKFIFENNFNCKDSKRLINSKIDTSIWKEGWTIFNKYKRNFEKPSIINDIKKKIREIKSYFK